jgi:hypothetical protein
MAWVIVSLAVLAAGLVHLRRQESAVRYQLQQLPLRHMEARRAIWDRRVEFGHLTVPRSIRHRADVMDLEMTDQANLESCSGDGSP